MFLFMDITMRTWAVAGGAYPTNSIKSTLTHSAIDPAGQPLCKGVKAGNLLDDSLATNTSAPPTCKCCLKRDPRFNGKGS